MGGGVICCVAATRRMIPAACAHLASHRVRAQLAAKEENVRLWPVDRIVRPAARLLHAEPAPFRLGEQALGLQRLCELLGENHVAAREGRGGVGEG